MRSYQLAWDNILNLLNPSQAVQVSSAGWVFWCILNVFWPLEREWKRRFFSTRPSDSRVLQTRCECFEPRRILSTDGRFDVSHLKLSLPLHFPLQGAWTIGHSSMCSCSWPNEGMSASEIHNLGNKSLQLQGFSSYTEKTVFTHCAVLKVRHA